MWAGRGERWGGRRRAPETSQRSTFLFKYGTAPSAELSRRPDRQQKRAQSNSYAPLSSKQTTQPGQCVSPCAYRLSNSLPSAAAAAAAAAACSRGRLEFSVSHSRLYSLQTFNRLPWLVLVTSVCQTDCQYFFANQSASTAAAESDNTRSVAKKPVDWSSNQRPT